MDTPICLYCGEIIEEKAERFALRYVSEEGAPPSPSLSWHYLCLKFAAPGVFREAEAMLATL